MSISSDKSHTDASISIVSRKSSWADLDLSLIKHAITKDIVPLKDDRAITNAVKNLILTNFYERPFQHDMGANLSALLFEPADFVTRIELRDSIYEVLSLYEPRVEIQKIIIKDNPDKNQWDVTIKIYIKHLSVQTQVKISLERLR